MMFHEGTAEENMAPKLEIPTSVLAALGLMGCTIASDCLSMTACLDWFETGDPDTGDTWAVCLSVVDSNETGQDTGCDSGDTGCEPPETSEQTGRRGADLAARAEALAGVAEALPDDVLARLQRE
jgi:hypothetical protein